MTSGRIEVVEGDLLNQDVDVIVNQDQTKRLMLDELSKLDVPMAVKIVVFKKAKT